jgi:hypothetical protein
MVNRVGHMSCPKVSRLTCLWAFLVAHSSRYWWPFLVSLNQSHKDIFNGLSGVANVTCDLYFLDGICNSFWIRDKDILFVPSLFFPPLSLSQTRTHTLPRPLAPPLSPPPKTPSLVFKQSFLSTSPISLSCSTRESLSFSHYQLLVWNFSAKTATTGHHHHPYFIFRGILNTSPQLIWLNLCLISVILILLNVMVLN